MCACGVCACVCGECAHVCVYVCVVCVSACVHVCVCVCQISGKEGVMDRWILCRLSLTIEDANSGFESYDFS